MLAATRRWVKRYRVPIALSFGVVGAGYLVTNYVVNKLRDARERMTSDRIAKENLRRRFEQNQEDCTFTVLALLPTATSNILEAMNVEKITYEIQQIKGSGSRAKSIGSTSPPSMSEFAPTDDDGRSIISVSVKSEAGLHATQLNVPGSLTSADAAGGSGAAEGARDVPPPPPKPRKTKRQLWDDLTICSITRAYTLIYTLGLLTMLTRIQLNLLGRRSYLSSVVSLATGGIPGTISLENNDDDSPEQAYGTDFDVNRKYLTFSWWLLNRGWIQVMHRVEAAVRQVFSHLSPRDTLSLETFTKLTRDMRAIVEGPAPTRGLGTSWLPFLLPPQDQEEAVLRESGVLDDATLSASSPSNTPAAAASLRRLLDETADLIESPAFSNVITQLFDAGFSLLLDEKVGKGLLETPTVSAATVDPVPSASDVTPPQAVVSRAILLPKILSVLTRQAHAIGNGMPNEYLQAMEAVRDLEGFAAVVYSSNWQADIAGYEEEVLGMASSSSMHSSTTLVSSQQQQQSLKWGPGEAQLPPSSPVPQVQVHPPLEEGKLVGSVTATTMTASVTVPAESSIVMVGAEAEASVFNSAWERASTGVSSGANPGASN